MSIRYVDVVQLSELPVYDQEVIDLLESVWISDIIPKEKIRTSNMLGRAGVENLYDLRVLIDRLNVRIKGRDDDHQEEFGRSFIKLIRSFGPESWNCLCDVVNTKNYGEYFPELQPIES